MGIRIKWLTNSAFEISYKNHVITTDPSVRFMAYKGLDENSYSKPDFILVTHLHWDHISEIRSLYSRYRPVIFTGALGRRELVRYLDANQVDVVPVYPGLSLDYGFFRLDALFAIHRNNKKTISAQLEAVKAKCTLIDDDILGLQEIGSLEMTNYLITFDNGFRILVWGGEFSEPQKNLLKNCAPDLALMQFSASRNDEYADLVRAVNPKALIPYHHDSSCTKEKWLPQLQSYRDKCPCEFIILDNEQTIEF